MVNCACAFNQPELGKYFEWIFELIISVSIVEFALGDQEIDISFFVEILHPVFEHPGFQVQSTEFLSVFLRAHPCLIAHKFALTHISRKKSKISWDFQGQIRRKISRFHGIFAGKKSKFAADFAGFSWEKSQNLQNNRLISWDFSRKKSIFEGFSGANS